jgi:four helix bundle protein
VDGGRWEVGGGKSPAPGLADLTKLEVWQDGIHLATDIYSLTKSWPSDERFGLISQARRAASSIPANIAEGVGRGGHGEIARFISIALGSAYELDTHLALAGNLQFTPTSILASQRSSLRSLINRCIKLMRYHQKRAAES